jgi:uncharacterized membrane protein (UPF0136 family)
MRLPVGVMRTTLAVVLIAAALALLQKADIGVPPAVVVGVPLVIAAVAAFFRVVRSRPPVPVLPEKA